MATTTVKSGFHGGSDDQLLVNPDGSINVNATGGSGSNASVGLTGAPVPSSATETGAVDSNGNLQTLKVDDLGALLVNTTGVISGSVVSHEAGLSNFATSQYQISTSLIQVTPTPLANRSSISLRVTAASGEAIFIGSSNSLTVNNGYPLYNGETLQMDLTTANSIYAIATSPTQTLFVLEIA